MYFVDRNQIEENLLYLEGILHEYQQHHFESFQERLSLERITHMCIESIIDVGNMMIDGFIMRDPGSYNDIVDILVDEKVLPATESDNYKAVIAVRKMLVQDYLSIDHNQLKETLTSHMQSLEAFSDRVRRYLDEELGPVSAFTN